MNDDSSKRRLKGTYGPPQLNVSHYYNAPVAGLWSSYFFWEIMFALFLLGISICLLVDVTIKTFISPWLFSLILTIALGFLWVVWIMCNTYAYAQSRSVVQVDGDDEILKPSARHLADIFAAIVTALYITVITLVALWLWWSNYGHYDVKATHATGEHALAIFKWKIIEIAVACLMISTQFACVKSLVSLAYPEGVLDK